jgi:hypothetical protein
MAGYLIEKGISPDFIRIEKLSTDTVGGVYFSKTLFIDPLGIRNIVAITSAFHLKRVKAVFEWILSLSPTKENYSITFISTDDTSLPVEVLNARVKQEVKNVDLVNRLSKTIKTVKEFNDWLFTKHAGYAYGLELFKIDDDTKKTY